MSKPPGRIIKTDDFIVVQGGEEYHPHEDESIEVLGSASPRDVELSARLIRVHQALDMADTPEEMAELVPEMDVLLNDLSQHLASRIKSWTWTDVAGEPMDRPTAEGIKSLAYDEIFYLQRICGGESKDAKKKGLKPLPITSLDTQTAESPKSRSTARAQ